MVSRPGSSPYLTEGRAAVPLAPDLTNLLNRTIDAQPFLGTLSADPTSRGLFSALGLLGQGVTHGDANLAPYAEELRAFHAAMAAAIAGHAQPLSWQDMLSSGLGDLGRQVSICARQAAARFQLPRAGRCSDRGDPRRGGQAAVRAERRGPCAHHRAGRTCRHAVRNGRQGDSHRADRQRGPDHTMAVACGAELAADRADPRDTRSRADVDVAVRCDGDRHAQPCFGGIRVCCSWASPWTSRMQFAVRFREARYDTGDAAEALRLTARRAGGAILVAALATAAGFLAFVPTAFQRCRRAWSDRRQRNADRVSSAR